MWAGGQGTDCLYLLSLVTPVSVFKLGQSREKKSEDCLE